MKFLVSLGHLEERQHAEVVALLQDHGIAFRETPGSIFGSGGILVEDRDFAPARELLREQSRGFAQDAREKWERDWRDEHKGSAVRWFANRARLDPAGTIARLLLLAFMVALFVVYPVWYVLRAGLR